VAVVLLTLPELMLALPTVLLLSAATPTEETMAVGGSADCLGDSIEGAELAAATAEVDAAAHGLADGTLGAATTADVAFTVRASATTLLPVSVETAVANVELTGAAASADAGTAIRLPIGDVLV
jgi:hypothetical protein